MKRVLICALASAALLVPGTGPAGAASQSTYRGELDGFGDAKVKLISRKSGGERQIIAFAVRDVRARCEGGRKVTLLRVALRGEIPVERRHFAVRDDNGRTTFKLSGRLGLRQVTGHFRYFGSIETEKGTRDCDTGPRSYTAHI
jgi:hypothetical protein